MHPQISTVCRYCGAPITQNEQRLGAVCRGWRCRRSQLDDDLRQFRDREAGREGRSDPARFLPVVVPYSPRDLVPLPSERRTLFLEHLDALIAGWDPELPESVRRSIDAAAANFGAGADADADADPGADVDASPDLDLDPDPVSGTADTATPGGLSVCAACRGVCCQDGGTHAFLDARRVREILAEQQWTGELLRSQFESFFHAATTENGCVFQAKTGCQVPRELRSHLCNTYVCAGLKRAEELIRDGATHLFVAARVDNRIKDGVFLVSGEDS